MVSVAIIVARKVCMTRVISFIPLCCKSSLRFSAYLCTLCVSFNAESTEIRRGRREMDHRLWSYYIEYGSPSGSGQRCRDGDRVLAAAKLSRQGCDREGRRTLPSRHCYRRRYTSFSRVTAG